jgi:cellulose synthase/poly-beta-1,6-N-acetylglucosamine synthase-like glycosyltransferase
VWGVIDLRNFLLFLSYSITILFSAWGAYHLFLLIVGVGGLPLEPERLKWQHPKISIMIPARNEPLLPRTIEACLFHMDYPDDRKEIVVVADDPASERIGYWYQQRYPTTVKLLARRQYYPTKPSALNDALTLCTGDIIAVMDVEDIPDRDVFMKAAAAISITGYEAVQAILRISNTEDSWITRIFNLEYAGWFRVWLNARYRLGVYAPLGGTGNYFKRSILSQVGGWDPTNLAEDAEVGIRIAIAGGRVAVINSRHWEEAPVTWDAWLKQRTRWFRGWMQSLWKYLRFLFSPTARKRLGFWRLLTVVLMLVGPFIVVFNCLAYVLTAFWFLDEYHITHLNYSQAVPIWSFIPLVFNLVYYLAWLEGGSLEGAGKKTTLIKYLPGMFVYCNFMMTIAALRALYQEIFKGVFWEKTTHPGRGVKWQVTGT